MVSFYSIVLFIYRQTVHHVFVNSQENHWYRILLTKNFFYPPYLENILYFQHEL